MDVNEFIEGYKKYSERKPRDSETSDMKGIFINLRNKGITINETVASAHYSTYIIGFNTGLEQEF